MLEVIKKKHLDSGGHCGLKVTDFKGDINQVKKNLNKLYKEKKITIREGIHGKLIFYADTRS
jgi:hypothetical protein